MTQVAVLTRPPELAIEEARLQVIGSSKRGWLPRFGQASLGHLGDQCVECHQGREAVSAIAKRIITGARYELSRAQR